MPETTYRTPGPARAQRGRQSAQIASLQRHIPELDGLRAVAILMVLLFHFGPTDVIPWLWRLAPLGFAGVDLFFVLSGFLITRILLATRTDAFYYRNFYVRRALRIFPAYYCVLALIFGASLLYQHGIWYRKLLGYGNPLWHWLYLGNVQMALIGSVPPVLSLAPLWSLHVEEQFYLLFPFVVRTFTRQTLVRVLIAAVFASPLLRWTLWNLSPGNPFLEYYLLPSRFEGLALGALLAADSAFVPRVSRHVLGALSVATTLIATVLLSTFGHRDWSNAFTRTVGYSLFPIAFACIVLWVIRFRGSWQTSWLNSVPCQFIGKRSYAIYLLQFPVSATWTALLGSQRLWESQSVRFALIGSSTVAIAALSWRYVESPIMRLKDRWAPMTQPARIGALSPSAS